MWFMNKLVNPLICFILRSPLHKMMSSVTLLLTYRGRKSGKTYTLPARYVQVEKAVYIIPGMPEQKTWWRNLRGGAAVTLTLKGKLVNGRAIVLQDDVDAVAEALHYQLEHFPPLAKMYGVRLDADGACNEEDSRKAAQSMVMVKVDLER